MTYAFSIIKKISPFSTVIAIIACAFFPDSSVGKESACNAGDLGSIPGSGRSPGEGIGYPLQYSWVSIVAQMVNNLPAMRDSSILAWRIPWTLSKFHFLPKVL